MNLKSSLNYLKGFCIHIIYLSIAAIIVSTGLLDEPHAIAAILIITIAGSLILIVILVLTWLNREYDKIYQDEKSAIHDISKEISSGKNYENLRVCGTSCTSIFSLFHEYSNAIANGKKIDVYMLDPDDNRIIEHLADCENDKEILIKNIQDNFSRIASEISETVSNEVLGMLESNDCYGKNLISASLLLWKEAHTNAKKKNKTLNNGLTIYLYSHLPNLKAWIFGENCIYIGNYNPLPGGVGINNPIKKIKGNRNKAKQIIQDCRRVTNFLSDHPNTKRIKNKI